MSQAAERVCELFDRIKYIPIQIRFLNGQNPLNRYFNQDDGLTLNEAGMVLFQKHVFDMAGFVKNQ